MNTTPQTFPYREAKPEAGINGLLRKGTLVTLLGQVQRIDVGWAGRLRVVLKTSMGLLAVSGSRESIPLDVEEGDWLRVRALRPHGLGEDDALRVLSARITMPDTKTAWLPQALCHREAHMRRLRALLFRLAPELQLVFTLAMSDAQVQRCFFWRVAAADHHGYPGGLFDQSVCAAELAHAQHHATDTERGVATLAALLFDLGKVSERLLKPDCPRQGAPLPHPLTMRRVERALSVLEPRHPGPVASLRAVLAQAEGSASEVPLAKCVREAVRRSWKEPHDA